MAVLDRINTAANDTFAARVAMLMMSQAFTVIAEAGTTTNHANRLALANRSLKGQVNNKLVSAAIIAHNPTIQGEIDSNPGALGSNVPDNDLAFEISQIYDAIANAYAAT